MCDDYMLLRRKVGNMEIDFALGHQELTEIANDCASIRSGGIHQYINKCMGDQRLSKIKQYFTNDTQFWARYHHLITLYNEAFAFYCLGVHFANGIQVQKSIVQAFKCFCFASYFGNLEAERWVEGILDRAKKVCMGSKKLLSLYELASDLGYPRGDFELGVYFSVDPDYHTEAKRLITRAARNGYLIAHQHPLCDLHTSKSSQSYSSVVDTNPSVQNTDLAAISPALRQEFYDAAVHDYKLGLACEQGIVKEATMTEAVNYYQSAAQLGYARAQMRLGECFEQGQGVEQSSTTAYQWYNRAAMQGDANGMFKVGTCLEHGSGVPQNPHEALKFYRRAADRGHANSLFRLGMRLLHDKDSASSGGTAEAIKCLQLAAVQDHALANHELGCFYYDRKGRAKNRALGMDYFQQAAIECNHEPAKVRYDKWLKTQSKKRKRSAEYSITDSEAVTVSASTGTASDSGNSDPTESEVDEELLSMYENAAATLPCYVPFVPEGSDTDNI